MSEKKPFESGKNWVNGSKQEVITEPGETLDDVIAFVRKQLVKYQRDDLFFWPHEIEHVEQNLYIVKLRSKVESPYQSNWERFIFRNVSK